VKVIGDVYVYILGPWCVIPLRLLWNSFQARGAGWLLVVLSMLLIFESLVEDFTIKNNQVLNASFLFILNCLFKFSTHMLLVPYLETKDHQMRENETNK